MLSLSQPDPAVKRRIAKRFGSLRKLSEAIGKKHSTVSRTLSGQLRNPETQKDIAAALGFSRSKLFGKAA